MKLRFHTVTCSRCGGSGKYSWCQMYGDTCFKCSGKGKVLSKEAANANAALATFAKTDPRVSARVGDLKPGDVVMGSDSGVTAAGQFYFKKARPVTLTAVDFDVEHTRLTLSWSEPELRKGPALPHSESYSSLDARRPLPLSGERWDAYLAFALTLKGCYAVDEHGAFVAGDDPDAAAAKRAEKAEKRRVAAEARRARNAVAAAEAAKVDAETLTGMLESPGTRAVLAAAKHPKIAGKTALDYAEWLAANVSPSMALLKLTPVLDAAGTVSREDL